MNDFDDDSIYTEEKTDEPIYWTRRQIILTLLALFMVIILLIYLALPTINYVIRQAEPPVPRHAPTSIPPTV